MRKLTVAFIVSLALLAVAPAQAGIPDLYSGSWPAKLMPSDEALGTITWVPVSEEWGRGVLDQPWGGAPARWAQTDGACTGATTGWGASFAQAASTLRLSPARATTSRSSRGSTS